MVTCPWACRASTKRRSSGPNPPTIPAGNGASTVSPDGSRQRSRRQRITSAESRRSRDPDVLAAFEPRAAGTAALSTRSAVIACASRLTPRGRFGRFSSLSAAPGCAACSMPDGRNGGRGGKPFSRATSSRSAVMVTCCASTLACKAVLSECSRRTSPTRRPAASRNSANKNLSSDAASGNDMLAASHPAPSTQLPRPGSCPGYARASLGRVARQGRPRARRPLRNPAWQRPWTARPAETRAPGASPSSRCCCRTCDGYAPSRRRGHSFPGGCSRVGASRCRMLRSGIVRKTNSRCRGMASHFSPVPAVLSPPRPGSTGRARRSPESNSGSVRRPGFG